MLKFDWKKLINQSCLGLTMGIIFLLPIYFGFILPGFNVFELPKMIIFKVLVMLLLLVSMIRFFAEEDPLSVPFIYKNNRIVHWSLVYLLAIGLSVIASSDIVNSIYGSYNRQQGYLSYVFYFLFFVLFIYNIRRRSEIDVVFRAIGVSSVLVCAYGLAQAAGWEYFHWSDPFSVTGRITSTFGQSNFLASYLLLVIPLVGYLFVNGKRLWEKIFWSTVFIVQLAALFFTYSRAGWIGLIGGSFFTFLVYLFGKRGSIKKPLIKALIFLMTMIFIIFGLFSLNNSFSSRVKSLSSIKSGSNAARMHFWTASWQLIGKKPIFGYGLENTSSIFAGKYQKEWATFGDVNDYPDRAHSLPLDLLLSGGVIVFMAYFSLMGVVFVVLIRKWRDGHDWLVLSALGSLSGYMLSLFFGFEVPSVAVYFWLLLAISAVITRDERKTEVPEINIAIPVKAVVILLVFLTSAYVARDQVRAMSSDYYFFNVMQAAVAKQPFQAYELFGYIEENGKTNKYYDRYMAGVVFDWATFSDDRMMRRGARDILIGIVKRSSGKDFNDTIARAKAEAVLAVDYDEYRQRALDDFLAATTLAPQMSGVYIDYAKALRLFGKTTEAMHRLDDAWSNLPNFAGVVGQDRQRNLVERQRYLIDMVWGDLYLDEKKYDQSIKAYTFAQKYNPSDNYINKKIANVYYSKKDYQHAIDYNKAGMKNEGDNYFWPFSLALLYKEIGDSKLSLEYAKKAQELSKDNPEVKRLLDDLSIKK